LGHMNTVSRKIVFLLFICLVALPVNRALSAFRLKPFHAAPDQVLVLYNSDWTKDVEGSEPGQDSREVAEYYQKMHTDSVWGKHPYLLGLQCVHKHGNHLNNWKISEKSQDNKDGIIFKGEGPGPVMGEWARDSRKIEIIINGKANETINWQSVEFTCKSMGSGADKKVKKILVSGIPQKKNRRSFIYPDVEQEKGRCYRFNAHELFSGTVLIKVVVRYIDGSIFKSIRLKYYDRDDFRFSEFGPDGISDEKHFQEDVAVPVKKFLEDPKNRLSDGTLLKDHILYIVVCHGLPYACESVFGIERGATPRSNDHGDLGSLEQRLQTLYYGWGTTIVPPVISMFMFYGPDSKKGVRNHRITSAMRYPLTGRRWNPHMHPDTYSFLGGKRTPQYMHLRPFPEERIMVPDTFFEYGVSRVDGQGPMEAKRIIDYSIYASKYLTPEMQTGKDSGNLAAKLTEAVNRNIWWGKESSFLGFLKIFKHGRTGIPFLWRKKPGQNLQNRKKVNAYAYYPGGMDFGVISNNGWDMGRSAGIWKQLDRGVTVSACGGPASGGGPHITNATFWDNRILMRYLFRGRDLGECFLRSTYYINWATSLIGDPLYHPDLNHTRPDKSCPEADLEHIKLSLVPSMGRFAGRLSVPVMSTPDTPEVALLSVDYSRDGSDVQENSNWPLYSSRPYVYLRNLAPDSSYTCRIRLTDPYGNTSSHEDSQNTFRFTTDSAPGKKIITRSASKTLKYWKFNILKMLDLKHNGTVSIDFIAGVQGLLPSFKSGDLSFHTAKYDGKRIKAYLTIGGPKITIRTTSPLEQGEKARLIVKWRKFPLTREAVLESPGGKSFVIIADTRTPWEEMKLASSVSVSEKDGLEILSGKIIEDALPASQAAFGIDIPEIDRQAWEDAGSEL